MIRIAVAGAAGRMGRAVIEYCSNISDTEVVAGIEAAEHPALGKPCGKGVITADIDSALFGCDVVIDFSTPAATVALAESCARLQRPLVCGVTGLSPTAESALEQAATRIAVIHATNFSVGMALLNRLVAEAARHLSPEYDIEIVETHHRRKADAPSGTALTLARTLTAVRRQNELLLGRGRTSTAKPAGQIGISSIRTGDVVGEHLVIFGGPGERLELGHKAESRIAFAAGAVQAARFAVVQPPGRYDIAAALGLSTV